MDFEALISRSRFLFNFFGLSQFDTRTNVSPKWVPRFAAVAYFSIIIVLFAISIYARYCCSNYNEIIFSIITYSHISSEVLLQLTIIGQVLFFGHQLKKLCCVYDFIQKYMRTRVGHSIEFGHFQKRIWLLTALVLLPHVTTIILRKALFSIHIGTMFSVIHLIFYFLSTLVKLHVLIQLELLKFFLKHTTHWLQSRTVKFSASKSFHQNADLVHEMNGYTEVLHLKLVHFKLWEVSTSVNRIFGWSMGAIIFRNFIEMAYGSYWFYLFSAERMFTYRSLLRM